MIAAVELDQVRVAALVCLLVVAVGAIGIGQRLPATHDDPELLEVEPPGMTQQGSFGLGQLGRAARVGVHSRELTHLVDTHLTGPQRSSHGFQIAQRPHRLQAAHRLGSRAVRQRLRPSPHRHVPIDDVPPTAIGLVQHVDDRRLHQPPRPLHLDQRLVEIVVGQRRHLLRRQERDRTHASIIVKGCDTLPRMAEQTEHWQIGDVGLTAIVEAETPGIPPQFFFPDIVTDDMTTVDWLSDGAASTDGTIAFRVQAFVVETRGRVVLVDPCVGNAKPRSLQFWNDLQLPWLDRFTAAGFDPDAVDLVVHTHLHEDHIGWDTHRRGDEWVPTFTNARHVYVGDELDYTVRADRRTKDDPYADSIAPILDAGLGDIVGADATLADGVRLVSTPGHTPGHVAVAVDTSG